MKDYLNPYDQIYALRNIIKDIQTIIIEEADLEKVVSLLDNPDTIEIMSYRRYLDA